MVFTKRLRERIRSGEITCSVRIWRRPRVKVGARYRMEGGQIHVDSIEPIGFPDITPELARESGFLGVLDLLKVETRPRRKYLSNPLPLHPPARQANKSAQAKITCPITKSKELIPSCPSAKVLCCREDQPTSTRQKSIPAIRTMRGLPSKTQRNFAVSGIHSSSPMRKSDAPMRCSVSPLSMSWPFST